MQKNAAKAKTTPQGLKRSRAATKASPRNTLKSSSWYSSASQSIAIGRGGDYRGGHHWVRHAEQE